MDNYGTCSHCGKPFVYGDETLRIQVIVKYKSQGYEDEFTRDRKEYHQECFLEYMKEKNKS